ncbi:MAG: cation:proton antiporter domain-containing protein [Candidatus Cyclobacteriaceae bacterium M3_2C_046]
MEIPILADIVIILGLSVIVIFLFQRLKIPTILGFLLTGMIAGPYGLSLVHGVHEVEIMAEIGVILLLFLIGMEFSLKSLAAIKRSVFIGGTLQVGLTILIIFLIYSQTGFTTGESIFLGFLVSLSSTAIVLKLLQDQGEINSPHGKVILAILIFQDIIVVPMMLFTPLLTGEATNILDTVLILTAKGIGVIVVVLIAANYLVPPLLHQIAKTKSNELFLISIIVICFAVAWGTASLGLSLGLGAFLAGLIISESEYNHHATTYILPFKEIFTSIFFVSIGMLMNIGFFIQHIGLILVFTLLAFIVKGLVAAIAAWALKLTFRTIILVSLSLIQIGEFSFILSKTGLAVGLIDDNIYQYFLSVSVLTLGLTPFIIQFAHFLADKLVDQKNQMAKNTESKSALEDHIIIIGYGLNGRNISRAAKTLNIPYLIVDLNAETVKAEKKNEPIIFGDAVQASTLQHLKVHKARVVVIAISDPKAIRRIMVSIRNISQRVHVIVRTRYIQEMGELFHLGADEVIPEEFETSIEIFHRVLMHYLVPRDEIESCIHQIRSDNYDMLRTMGKPSVKLKKFAESLPLLDIASLKVQKPDKQLVGKKLAESNLRKTMGVNIVAIKRGDQLIYEIDGDSQILMDDILYALGKPEAIQQLDEKVRTGSFLHDVE